MNEAARNKLIGKTILPESRLDGFAEMSQLRGEALRIIRGAARGLESSRNGFPYNRVTVHEFSLFLRNERTQDQAECMLHVRRTIESPFEELPELSCLEIAFEKPLLDHLPLSRSQQIL